MDSESIECVSSIDGMDQEETSVQHLHSSKTHGVAAPPPSAITPATSVHELLECPVCTNSMYPPIHQLLGYKGAVLFGYPARIGEDTAILCALVCCSSMIRFLVLRFFKNSCYFDHALDIISALLCS